MMGGKADRLRGRVLEIAQYRRCGHTWGQIAAHLTTTGIPVTESEIRATWPRLSRGQDAREIISARADQVMATALASLIACAALQARVTRLEVELKEARDRAADLKRDLAAADIMAPRVGRRR